MLVSVRTRLLLHRTVRPRGRRQGDGGVRGSCGGAGGERMGGGEGRDEARRVEHAAGRILSYMSQQILGCCCSPSGVVSSREGGIDQVRKENFGTGRAGFNYS